MENMFNDCLDDMENMFNDFLDAQKIYEEFIDKLFERFGDDRAAIYATVCIVCEVALKRLNIDKKDFVESLLSF